MNPLNLVKNVFVVDAIIKIKPYFKNPMCIKPCPTYNKNENIWLS